MSELIDIAQFFIAAGGLAVAVKISGILSKVQALLERAVSDIQDHEKRLRNLEKG
jgi:hypothetical protein